MAVCVISCWCLFSIRGSILRGLTHGSPVKHQARRGGRMQDVVRLLGAATRPMLLMGQWCRGRLLSALLLAIGQGAIIVVLRYEAWRFEWSWAVVANGISMFTRRSVCHYLSWYVFMWLHCV